MKRNKGSLTVEACMSFTIFLMVFLTIMYIVRIVFAYGIVQHAINQAAKEISSYTYFYAASGLKSIDDTIQSSTAAGKDKFNKGADSIVKVYTELGELGDSIGNIKDSADSGNIGEIYEGFEKVYSDTGEFADAVSGAKDTIMSIADNPVAAIKSVGSVMLSGANETVKTALVSEIARALMAKYIDSKGYQAANTRLKNLRIVDGLDGLNFSASKYWSGGNDIEIVVCYTINPIFPIKVMDEVNLMNRITVRGWNGESIF